MLVKYREYNIIVINGLDHNYNAKNIFYSAICVYQVKISFEIVSLQIIG